MLMSFCHELFVQRSEYRMISFILFKAGEQTDPH